ncbi:MAG: PspA/IM30 family protein [Acidimicrobiia bacterium]|nr:PspA/IM30 family protein [Acidimicrobiia bacterium]
MIKLMKRWWAYTTARLTGRFEDTADPKVQLEQAITEAQDQHRRLKEQAANVIANQKQTEMRLSRALEDFEKVNGNARQAVLMADEASKVGNHEKMGEYTSAAEAFANRMIGLEREIEDLKALHQQSSQASEQARTAVSQNSTLLQRKLSERQKLLGQLDQANMQDRMNKAMASLSETVGEDVPTFEQIREKIETRYAKAKGMAELSETSVESKMLEIEQAARNSEAKGRLDEIRSQLGLPAAGTVGAAELQSKIQELKDSAPEGAPVGADEPATEATASPADSSVPTDEPS